MPTPLEIVGDAAGQLADRVHFLNLPDLGFGGLPFGQVAPDEEMAPDRLRPGAHPGQCYRMAFLVDVAGLEITHLAAVPRRPHFIARVFEIVRVDEFHGAAPDHLGRLVTDDGLRAR